MKYLQIFIFVLAGYAAQCPNLCSSHGSCNANGLCNCYPGWTEGDCSARTCPYGERIADPDGHNEENFLECSGQGHCNRASGECECYPGYAGSACHRTECVNQCSGHGVCTRVGYMGIEYNTYYNPYYYDGNYKLSKYDSWDSESMYSCVCDKEYTGYDCSQRKCATGYKESSDCDVSSIYTQTIAVTARGYTVKDENDPNQYGLDGCIAYAEYTDTFNRTWYTRPFNIFKDMTLAQYKEYIELEYKDGTTTPHKVKPCGYYEDQYPSFLEALKTLPSGTIDVTDVNYQLHGNDHPILISITYGSQQTGRQQPIRIITAEDEPLKNVVSEKPCANIPQVKRIRTYPGTTDEEKKDDTTYFDGLKKKYGDICPTADDESNKCTDKDFYASYLHAFTSTTSTTYIPPLECSNNGLCNRQTGLCQCFDGYYGLACTESTPVV